MTQQEFEELIKSQQQIEQPDNSQDAVMYTKNGAEVGVQPGLDPTDPPTGQPAPKVDGAPAPGTVPGAAPGTVPGMTPNAEADADPELQEVLAPVDTAIKSFDDYYNDIVKERAARDKEMQKQIKKNNTAMIFGGAAEVAASLTNIFGTMKGAAPMQWSSPQAGWQTRAQQAIREREARLQKYDAEMQGYRKQSSALQAQKSKIINDYRKAKIKAEGHLQEVIVKTEADLAIKKQTLGDKTWTSMSSKAIDAVNGYLRHEAAMGREVSRNVIDAMYRSILNSEIEMYSKSNPTQSGPALPQGDVK